MRWLRVARVPTIYLSIKPRRVLTFRLVPTIDQTLRRLQVFWVVRVVP